MIKFYINSKIDVVQHYTFKTFLPEQIKAESNNQAPRPENTGDRNKLNDTIKKKNKLVNIGHSRKLLFSSKNQFMRGKSGELLD